MMTTPLVRITAYEVDDGNDTETVLLDSVCVQSYGLKNIDCSSRAAGRIPDGPMKQIPQSVCEIEFCKLLCSERKRTTLNGLRRSDFHSCDLAQQIKYITRRQPWRI